MPLLPSTIGVLLAGGSSRRMGGGDKPMREVGARTMLERVTERLRSQCTEVILNANGDPTRFSFTGLPVIPDDLPDAGPLAGILVALDWAAAHRPEIGWVVSIATDTPFLPNDFVQRLHHDRQVAGAPLCCATSGDRVHPVNGLWAVGLRGDLRHALASQKIRKVTDWTSRHHVALAAWKAEPFDPFFNANTPDDLVEAEAMIQRFGEI